MMSLRIRAIAMTFAVVLWTVAGATVGVTQTVPPAGGGPAAVTSPSAAPVPPAPAAAAAAAIAPRPAATPAPPPTEPVGTTDSAVSLPADGHVMHDLSPWSMFMSADILVKAVMVSLALASLVTWTILFAKTVEVATARRRLTADLARVAKARSIAEARLAAGRNGLLRDLLDAAESELDMTGGGATRASVRERADLRFSDRVRVETQSLRRGMGLLATIGAISPFVGLFGTVWGIMNSFIGISKSQTTNLAVVAPGIAEALLATATGLAAAIPAVIIYNHFSRATRSHLILVHRAVGTATRLLSHELDHDAGFSARAAE